MKILVTGANGQLGWELTQQVLPNSITLNALTRTELDMTHPTQIDHVLAKYQPDLLINTAAYTAVDKAEQEAEMAYAVNHIAVATIAQACTKINIPMIQLSTDYVFGGDKTTPYEETDPTKPINVYCASKLAGETAVQSLSSKYIILRVSGVFSQHGHNFVKTILRAAQEKETLHIVADQTSCPTPAADIAATLIQMSQSILQNTQPAWGIYQYCSSDPTSWYHFTEAIIAAARTYKPLTVKQILPITAAEYPTPAKRPAYSVLDCDKLQSQFEIQPQSWHPGLKKVIQALMSE